MWTGDRGDEASSNSCVRVTKWPIPVTRYYQFDAISVNGSPANLPETSATRWKPAEPTTGRHEISVAPSNYPSSVRRGGQTLCNTHVTRYNPRIIALIPVEPLKQFAWASIRACETRPRERQFRLITRGESKRRREEGSTKARASVKPRNGDVVFLVLFVLVHRRAAAGYDHCDYHRSALEQGATRPSRRRFLNGRTVVWTARFTTGASMRKSSYSVVPCSLKLLDGPEGNVVFLH